MCVDGVCILCRCCPIVITVHWCINRHLSLKSLQKLSQVLLRCLNSLFVSKGRTYIFNDFCQSISSITFVILVRVELHTQASQSSRKARITYSEIYRRTFQLQEPITSWTARFKAGITEMFVDSKSAWSIENRCFTCSWTHVWWL